MNKKFLSAILFGALMVTSTGTFVSCKDYDDDIDSLKAQVDANKSECTAGVQALNGQIATLQTALTTAQATADAAKKAAADAQATGDAAVAAAEAAAAAAAQAKADAIAKAIEEAENLKAWVVAQNYVTDEQLAEALLPISAKISAIEETLDQITVYITENLEANIQTALKNIMALQEDLAIQQATLEEYEALIEELQAGDQELWAELATTREELQNAVTALNNLLEKQTGELWEEIALARQELSNAITNLANIQADDKAALMAEIEQILLANKTTSETLAAIINVHADDKAALMGEIELILAENAKLTETISSVITLHGEDKAALEAEIAALKADLEAKAEELGNGIKNNAGEIQKLWNEIEQLINQNVKTTETLSSLAQLIEDLNASHDADKKELEGKIADVKAELSKSITDGLAALNATISATMEDKLAEVWTSLEEGNTKLNAAINKNVENIQGLNDQLLTLHLLVKNYLTSMTFAPSLYVDGIEAIPFRTLKYNPWIKLATVEEGQESKALTLSDGTTEANYFVSPANIDIKAIESLNVLLSDAVNVNSRTVAPITAEIKGVKAGKMTVNLKKNSSEVFGGNGNEFKIMALQAIVNRGALNPNVKSHEVYTVTSDWARIHEAHYLPQIHAEEDNFETPHLWSYTQGKYAKEGQFILATSDYMTPINLNKLVTVCLTDIEEAAGESMIKLSAEEIKAYGMKFEFSVDFDEYLLKQGTPEETDQQKFATITVDENGDYIMTSRAMNGATENKDAIGREPLVQVVLKDEVNGKVVDVNYFKIKWTAVSNPINLGALTPAFEGAFECGKDYTFTVKTEKMNEFFYTKLNISKEEFHLMYKPDNYPNGFVVRNAKGEEIEDAGSIMQTVAQGSTTTYNIEWKYTTGAITKEEWAAKKVERTVYLTYVNQANPAETITFNMSFVLNIEDMALAAGYVQTYWTGDLVANNAAKLFQVNPALTSDKNYGIANYETCRIITNMLHGYNVTGIDADDLVIEDIVSENVSEATFKFDAKKASEMNKDWTVSADGLTLLVDGVEAAQITMYEGKAFIKLFETDNYNVATEAAKTLVGKMVPVQLVGTHCSGYETVLDSYLVHFIEPLAAKFNMTEGKLEDLLTDGAALDIRTAVTVAEKFGLKRDVIYVDANGKLAANSELVSWYAVEPATWDLENAVTNLNIDKNNLVITDKFDTKFSAHSDKYQLEVVKNASGYPVELKFHNFSGTHIQQAFKVQIPVYVETKWNSKLTAEPKYVEVTIVPGVTE